MELTESDIYVVRYALAEARSKLDEKEDDRYLWPEMLRVISELRPAWVVGENVAGIVNMALDQVYDDLENEGYAVQALIIPACAVDAPHRRDRCAIIAHTVSHADNGGRSMRGNGELPAVEEDGGSRADHRGGTSEYVAGEWWPAEPNVGRVAHGVPHRVDRLKCLGNAVVPQQFYPIFQAIADIERGHTWMTSDVAPVIHGRWEEIRDPYGNIEGWLCKCGTEVKSKDNYCPNCGAKMDKE